MNSRAASSPLTGEQQEAASSVDPVIAILAGPGSGKTRTLCERARILLERHPSGSVLLLTFMNKAAGEMKARALATTAATSERLLASTYHTFGLRLLDVHREQLGLDDIDVLDEVDAKTIVSGLASSMGIRRPDGARYTISQQRLRDIPMTGKLGQLEEAYAEHKRDLGVVDFDDLIVFAADLLDGNPELAASWALRYPHLLVDEFQDTNAAQFRLIRALARHMETVTVVADDDQAIMGFAGADAGNVAVFISELGARIYPLRDNHRCRQRIVEAANRLIACDSRSSGRQMRWTHEGGVVADYVFDGVQAEALWLAADAQERVERGVAPHDMAVLARSAVRADAVMRALRAAGLPVNDWRTNPQPDEARTYLATNLACLRAKLSPRMLQRTRDLLGFEGDDRETHKLLERNANLPVAQQLVTLKEAVFDGLRPSEIVERVATIVGEVDQAHSTGIAVIARQVRAFEEYDADFSTEHLMDHLALGMPAHGAPSESGGIKVSTLHRTKGLEWPHVWIVGLEDDTLPSYFAIREGTIHDERRLLFVGVCRAEQSLALTRVRALNGYNKVASRFLGELME